MHTHSLQKRPKPDESRRVCHPLSFLLSQNLGMSFAINVKEGIIERRNKTRPRQLIAQSTVNEIIIRH